MTNNNPSDPHDAQRGNKPANPATGGSGEAGGATNGDGRLDSRALIASADPAASLTPLRADQLHRLKESAMSNDTTRHAPSTDTPGAASIHASDVPHPSRRRNGRRWIIAGAAGIGLAAAAAVAIPTLSGSDDPATPPVAATSEFTQPDSAGAGAPAAMCAELTAQSLSGNDTAFRAEVTSIDGDRVTLAVTDRFKGAVNDTATTTQGDGSGVDGAPLVFDEGETYLISTNDGQIITCGVSGPQDPALEDLYRTAYTP